MSIENGCGPSWVPGWLKKLLGFNWFHETSCNKHDNGYHKGGTEFDRWRRDFKFFKAMLRDVKRLKMIRRPLAYIQAILFYVLVVLFGWFQFNYRFTKND